MPTQVTRILRSPAATSALAGFAGVLVGGAALSPALRAGAVRAGATMVETYGSTETCGGVVYDGTPLSGVSVRIDEAGTVLMGGRTIATGYLGQPGLTEQRFRDGWFHTADHGRWSGDRLRVLGRTDDVVKVGGVKVSLPAVTDILRSDHRVLDACVVALPDPEWGHRTEAYVVPADEGLVRQPQGRVLVRDLCAEVERRLGRRSRPARLAVVADLPVTAAGKPRSAAGA